MKSVRIAMWSGPRNISTALMRSWEARCDTFVCDEPLYAHYLKETGTDHPGREAIIDEYETDWRKVTAWLTGDIPEGKAIFYQKHMAHHVLPDMKGPWLEELRHAFLLRNPREMLISLCKVMERPTVADTGLPQQWELFEDVRARTGTPPPILDARDVLQNPKHQLTRLCEKFGVPFTERMLHWEAGPHPTDGIWAPYWYDNVQNSTGFQPYTPRIEALPEHLVPVFEECLPYYERMSEYRLTD